MSIYIGRHSIRMKAQLQYNTIQYNTIQFDLVKSHDTSHIKESYFNVAVHTQKGSRRMYI
jgi:hypothetical protein